jgi:glycosyltransferase involved in cell wall biosynthesis
MSTLRSHQASEDSVFVSYVVATYNCADRVRTLNETIQRLANTNCEFCISDGASSDGTLAAIADAPNVRVLRSAPDNGIYDAWNQVLDECRGEYLAFIGVDDQPIPGFVEAAKMAFTSANQSPLLIYGDRILQRGKYRRILRYSDKPRLLEADKPVFDIPHQGALNHRSLFEMRQFDGQFQLAGDLDFFIALRDTIRRGGYRHLSMPQILASEEGLSRSAASFRIYMREFRSIEQDHGLTLGYPKTKLRLLNLAAQIPGLFGVLKSASWIINHDRA